jgi:hypothetical protein
MNFDAEYHVSVLTGLLEGTIDVSFPVGAASLTYLRICGPALTENEASKLQ